MRLSEETKRKISDARKGQKPSLETRNKMSIAHKGHTVSEDTKRKISRKGEKHWAFGKKFTQETKEKMSQKRKNRKGVSSPNFGNKHSEKTKQKIGDRCRGKTGELSPNWQGGKTSKNLLIRNSREYKLWREAVFARDNWVCIWCGQIGGKLNADHIKSFAHFPELRFAIDNGRTLCVECHKTTDSYGWKGLKRIKK